MCYDWSFNSEAATSMQSFNLTDQVSSEAKERKTGIESNEEIDAIRQHVKEIVEGSAFKGSSRSIRFLEYVIEKKIIGDLEALKERVIGSELFGRSPSYSTGDDSIVRVAANQVRKRLLRHYSVHGETSEFHLDLPSGSYIPEITRSNHLKTASIEASNGSSTHYSLHDVEPVEETSASTSFTAQDASPLPPAISVESRKMPHIQARWWLLVAMLVLVLNAGLWIFFAGPSLRMGQSPLSYLPWSVLFHSANPTVVITSDPNIAEIQGFTGGQISVSDYANHNYLRGPNVLTPEEERFCRGVLLGNKAASVDTPIAVSAAELAQSVSRKLEVRGARDLELSDLKTDANFIILGSPRSDPWSDLFSDQLDFKFVLGKGSREFIFNTHPRSKEQASYVPTAPGGATGLSYAIVAFLQNPYSNGRVLLLAGANGEGTEAAGDLVTDLPRLSQALDQCGLVHARPAANFEMLLRLNTMAGLPSYVDVIACHILRGSTP